MRSINSLPINLTLEDVRGWAEDTNSVENRAFVDHTQPGKYTFTEENKPALAKFLVKKFFHKKQPYLPEKGMLEQKLVIEKMVEAQASDYLINHAEDAQAIAWEALHSFYMSNLSNCHVIQGARPNIIIGFHFFDRSSTPAGREVDNGSPFRQVSPNIEIQRVAVQQQIAKSEDQPVHLPAPSIAKTLPDSMMFPIEMPEATRTIARAPAQKEDNDSSLRNVSPGIALFPMDMPEATRAVARAPARAPAFDAREIDAEIVKLLKKREEDSDSSLGDLNLHIEMFDMDE